MEYIKVPLPELAPAPSFPVKPLLRREWGNGVIVRMPNWLGDAIMALPALTQLRKIIPAHCGLFVVCHPGLTELFQAIPIIDQVIPLTQAHKMWTRQDLRRINRLGAGMAIMLNNSLRDAICFRLARVPRLIGGAARGRSFLLSRSFNFPPRRDAELNQLHHAQKYLAMVYALGAPVWHGELPKFRIDREKIAGSNPETIAAMRSESLLTLAAGAAYGGSKRWPAESFNQVAKHWIEQGGDVAMLGSGKEAAIGAEVLAGLPPEKAFNLAGKTNFQELMALLQRSRFCMANDSGIMHLSAALDGSGIAVFGPTDPSATSPISAHWSIIFEKQPCAPCFKRECPRHDPICMTEINAKKVIKMMDLKSGEANHDQSVS